MGIASLLCVLFPQEAVARDAGNQLDKADLEGWYVGVSAIGPKATIRPIEDGDHVLEAGARWHLTRS